MGIIYPTQIVACYECGTIYWRNSEKTTNTDKCPNCQSQEQVPIDWKKMISNSKK